VSVASDRLSSDLDKIAAETGFSGAVRVSRSGSPLVAAACRRLEPDMIGV